MGSTEVVTVLGEIAEARARTDHRGYINLLLDDRNWRSHLIGLAAALVSDDAETYASVLWRAFDRGSWVAPQLAVSLYCSDPRFIEEAKRRIALRCPILDDDGFFRGQTREVSAKNLAALLRVVAFSPSEASWAASEVRVVEVDELLHADRDSSGMIAEDWFQAARARFTEFGRTLGAAA
jgi:hypothetical protein